MERRGREGGGQRGREGKEGEGGDLYNQCIVQLPLSCLPKCDSAGPSATGILCSQCIVCSTLLAFLQDFTALHCVHCDVPITKKEHMFWLVLTKVCILTTN